MKNLPNKKTRFEWKLEDKTRRELETTIKEWEIKLAEARINWPSCINFYSDYIAKMKVRLAEMIKPKK